MNIRIDPAQPLPLSLFNDPMVAAVVISLFTDARARKADGIVGDQRGWWGDALEANGDTIGGLLWLFARAKNLPETLRKVEDAARKALQWMLDDQIVDSLTVLAAAPRKETLQLVVVVDGYPLELEVLQA